MGQGIVIAGTHSGCGKTTVTLGLLAAFKKKGLKVQAFKTGPDFIDTGLHRLITGRPSRNLDLWMCGEEVVKNLFAEHASDSDVAVVEGVMGMYDGKFSTAALAGLLRLPVLLVVDAYGLAESAGAIVMGFSEYGMASALIPDNNSTLLAGVVFNRVASEKHFSRLKRSVFGVDVLGYLPRDLNFEIPHRHLGLVVAEENPVSGENMENLAATVSKYIDLDRISALCTEGNSYAIEFSREDAKARKLKDHILRDFAASREKGNSNETKLLSLDNEEKKYTTSGKRTGAVFSTRIAVAYDRAFCFYYEDNLEMLKNFGAEIVTFSPLSDRSLPNNVDAVYLGGGYPELYAKELSGHTAMLESISEWAGAGKPIYAECGGLMYLSRGIHDFDQNFFKMTGVFPFETAMKKGRSFLGYREIELKEDCILGLKGQRIRGHEFHYSDIKDISRWPEANFQFIVRDDSGRYLCDEGYRFMNTLASYVHVHFGSNLNIAGEFVNFIQLSGAVRS